MCKDAYNKTTGKGRWILAKVMGTCLGQYSSIVLYTNVIIQAPANELFPKSHIFDLGSVCFLKVVYIHSAVSRSNIVAALNGRPIFSIRRLE